MSKYSIIKQINRIKPHNLGFNSFCLKISGFQLGFNLSIVDNDFAHLIFFIGLFGKQLELGIAKY